MPNDEQLPAAVQTTSASLQPQSSGLVTRGLLAIQRSLALAEAEDAESLFQKGMRFRNGDDGTRRDDVVARSYLLAAAKKNHAGAQFELSIFLGENGEWPEAIAFLERSVAQGFGPAQEYLAEWLSSPEIGDHLPKIADHLSKRYDASRLYDQAAAWYELRANAGDASAQYGFALMLSNPEAPNYNQDAALRWMKAAAEQSHGSACRRLGEWLLDDKAPHHDTEHGIYWLSRAARLGELLACRRLGNLYLRGHLGHRFTREGFSQIIRPDKRLAVFWYERAIELEVKFGSFMSFFSLAREYLFGEHLDQDLALAERMLLQAANLGNLDSQRLLAYEYTSGKRLKRSTASALNWLTAAEQNAESSEPLSHYQLGNFYENEADNAPNYVEAIKWYRKAADAGDYRSQKRLGEIHECGKSGVAKDYVQACKWYLLSAANSYGKPGIRDFHTGALRSPDLLAYKMTAAQLVKSRRLAREWMDQVKSLRPSEHELAREGLESAS